MPTRPPVHRSPGVRTQAQVSAASKSSAERGYGAGWRKLRAAQPRTPCQCGCGEAWRPGFHLDHIKARKDGGSDDPSNLQWLSPGHHGRKTALKDGRWGVPSLST